LISLCFDLISYFLQTLAAAEVDAEAVALQVRVDALKDSASLAMFLGVSRGLFQRHKLVFAAELCFRSLIEAQSLDPLLLSFLVRSEDAVPDMESPFKEWLDASQWHSVISLSTFELPRGGDEEGNNVVETPFAGLDRDMLESSRRFRDWHDLERPEEAALPGDWKKIPEAKKLLVIRALRPDRLMSAISAFVKNEMGYKYLVARRNKLKIVIEDSSAQVPILFVLTPGLDAVKDVEILAETLEMTYENKRLALVSLGPGQEALAERIFEQMMVEGGWLFLQNLHLLKPWTSAYLEEKVQEMSNAHEDFRLFVTTEASFAPIAILKTSIKLTNEAPDGLQANILKAMQPFDDEFFEMSSSASDLKAIVFGVCVFHAVLVQRNKFGAIGTFFCFHFFLLYVCAWVPHL